MVDRNRKKIHCGKVNLYDTIESYNITRIVEGHKLFVNMRIRRADNYLNERWQYAMKFLFKALKGVVLNVVCEQLAWIFTILDV